MGFLDDLGLLARHIPGDARNALKGLLGDMPLTKALRGESEVSANGLKNALMGMQVGPDAQGSYDAAMQIGPQAMGGLLGKIVYHGSPHKFDKFDASKIGTGEGAQAYGHGVYLAEAPEVAKGYRDTLALPEVQMGGATFEPKDNIYKLATHAQQNGLKTQDEVVSFWKDRVNESKAALRAQQSGTADWRQNSSAEMLARRNEMLALAKKTDPSQISINEGGALYKADLPDEWIPKMLDWDKPLSQQPENVRLMAQDFGLSGDATGKDIYYALSNQARDIGIIKGQPLQTTLPGSQEKATADLLGFGVPGIRYMDGGSRMTPTQEESIKKALERAMARGDEGVANSLRAQLENRTSNYVVFPGLEDKVKILERNGVSLSGLLGQ